MEKILNLIREKTTNHVWSSELECGMFMNTLARMHGAKNILECGVFKGITSLFLLDAVQKMKGNYVGIDIEDHREEVVKEKMEHQRFVLGNSLTEVPKLPPRTFGLIFLDSVHTLEHLREEFKVCERVVTQNGLICIHDTVLPQEKVLIDYIKQFAWFEVLNLNTPGERGLTIVKCLFA